MRDWVVGGAVIEVGIPGLAAVGGVTEGVLLVENRRRDGRSDWTPPGGVIDPGEDVVDGLTREVREETGLEVVPQRPVGQVTIPGDGVVFEVIDFTCTLVGTSRDPVPGDDAAAALFADAATLDRLAATPRLIETLRGWGVLPR
jgi:8-oxo-dGTP diphosphatase